MTGVAGPGARCVCGCGAMRVDMPLVGIGDAQAQDDSANAGQSPVEPVTATSRAYAASDCDSGYSSDGVEYDDSDDGYDGYDGHGDGLRAFDEFRHFLEHSDDSDAEEGGDGTWSHRQLDMFFENMNLNEFMRSWTD